MESRFIYKYLIIFVVSLFVNSIAMAQRINLPEYYRTTLNYSNTIGMAPGVDDTTIVWPLTNLNGTKTYIEATVFVMIDVVFSAGQTQYIIMEYKPFHADTADGLGSLAWFAGGDTLNVGILAADTATFYKNKMTVPIADSIRFVFQIDNAGVDSIRQWRISCRLSNLY